MSISPATVLDILFIPLTSLVLTFATRALDSKYEDAKSEKVIYGYLLYGIFIFINVCYFLTNNRYFRVKCLLNRTLFKTKGIHAKCVTTLGTIQGFRYEAYENLFRFYVQSIAVFSAHCYPIFILLLQPDGPITKLLGVLFTTLLFFESIDAGDRLLKIVRLASYIIYVCICGGLIAFQLFEYLMYAILTMLLVACWRMRPNRRPLYKIFNFINRNSEKVEFEPVKNIHIPEEQRVRSAANEKTTEQLDVGFRCEIQEYDEFKLMEVDSQLPQQVKRPFIIENNKLMHGELRMPIETDQFNQGIYDELEEPRLLDEGLNSEQIEAEQLNQVIAVSPLERRDFNQEKYGVHIKPDYLNREIDCELIETEHLKQGIDRELIEIEHLKQRIAFELIETEHLKQGIGRELIETEHLNQGIDRMQIELEQLKQGIDREQIELEQLKQGIDLELIETQHLNQGIDRELIETDNLNQGIDSELIETEHLNHGIICKSIELDQFNQEIIRMSIELDRSFQGCDRELIEPEQFNKEIDREQIKPQHYNQYMACVPMEPNLNQGTYIAHIDTEQLNQGICLAPIETQQFIKYIDSVRNVSENLNQETYHESMQPDNMNRAINRVSIETKHLNRGIYRDPLAETEQLDTRHRKKIDEIVHILGREFDKRHQKETIRETVHTDLILSEAVQNDLGVLGQTAEGPWHKLEERDQKDQTGDTTKASAFVEYDLESFKHGTLEQDEFTRKHFNHHWVHKNTAPECVESSPNPTDTEINPMSASSSFGKTNGESIGIQSSNTQTLKRKNPKINITDLIRFYERSGKKQRIQIVDDGSERNSNCTLGAEYENDPNVCEASQAISCPPYYTLSKDLDSMPIMNSDTQKKMPNLPFRKSPTDDSNSSWRSQIQRRINIGYNLIGFNFVAYEEPVSDSLSNNGTKNNSDNFSNVARKTSANPYESNVKEACVQNGSSPESKIGCLNTLKQESHESEMQGTHKEISETDRTINMERQMGERSNVDCMQIFKKILKEYSILNETTTDSSEFPEETSDGLKDSQAERKELLNSDTRVESINLNIDSSCRDTPEEELNLNPNTTLNENVRMNLECIKGTELGNTESPKQSNSNGIPNTPDTLQAVETCAYDTCIEDSSQKFNPVSSTETIVTALSLFSVNEMKAKVSGNEVENDDVSNVVDSDKETCLMQNEESENSESFEASCVYNVVNEIDSRFIYSVS